MTEKELLRMQRLNKSFYNDQIPKLLKSLNSDIGRINARLNEMMNQPPSEFPEHYKTAKLKIERTWPLLRRLDVEIFRTAWDACTDEPFIDLTKVKLANWKYQSGMAVFFYEGLMLKDELAEIEK